MQDALIRLLSGIPLSPRTLAFVDPGGDTAPEDGFWDRWWQSPDDEFKAGSCC